MAEDVSGQARLEPLGGHSSPSLPAGEGRGGGEAGHSEHRAPGASTFGPPTPSLLREGAGRERVWKRPLDVVLALLALVVALPLIGLVALAVVLDSPGPPLLGQVRVGRGGRPFRMWKLRSMRAGCDQSAHRRAAADWFAGEASGGRFKTLADPRITRVGRVLRRTNLDELPQLLNVLRGDMSLVGPRPAIAYELAHYQPGYFARLTVLPGMTGLWQVTRRDRLSANQMMELDLQYVARLSPWLDLKILAMTVPALLASAIGGY
jgi:lipopolysaccharide/colanic/teichoic acid biosynthesis glycosyltransferase